jgi:branched-chain amino acid aminotransferase
MSSFDYTSSQAFFRDVFVPFADANVSIASSPVLYGLSVYTVFAVNWNDAEKKHYTFRLKDHYRRLVNSAAIMDFNNFAPAWPYEKFEATMRELITRNAAAVEGQDVLVRATIFVDALIAGTKMHDLPHAFAAYIYPVGQILPRGGVNVCVSSWTRNADNAIPARAKVNGGYVNSSLMKNEALRNGYDDAIALDAQGHVTEATVANVFIVRNGVLITPGASADLLEGITRATVITLARAAGIPVEERAVDRTELYIADEAFLCGSSARLIPILSVDKRAVGVNTNNAGALGPITKILLEKFNAAQAGNDRGVYKEWRVEI